MRVISSWNALSALLMLILAQYKTPAHAVERHLPTNVIRIPLTKHSDLTIGSSTNDTRSTRVLSATDSERIRTARLLHQQERIRRRLHENTHDSPSNDTTDSRRTVSPLVVNEVPLGVGYGTHYAELYLGIPAQRASMIVDTGSHLTALPCSSCKGCGDHTDPLFDVSKSTTAKYMACHEFGACNTCEKDQCIISQAYTEGSMWRAVVVDELVWLGGFTGRDADIILKNYGIRFPVGCQTKETGLFITQKENGIMGLGRHKATMLSYMLNAKRVEHDVFTLCYGRSGGSFMLGGVDYSQHMTTISYTPLLRDNSGWYPVKVKDIWVSGKSIGVSSSELNSGRGVIVDSGTTDTFFVSSGSRGFLSAFKEAAGMAYSERKMDLSTEDLKKLPNITIVLQGMTDGDGDVQLEIPPEKYLTQSEDGSYYYGNFHFSERTGGVLGASSMVGYDVIFDAENERVGFAESECDAPSESTTTSASTAAASSSTSTSEPSSGSGNTLSTSNLSKDATTDESGVNVGKFITEVVVVTLVGLIVVAVAFKRMRKRSWVAIPEESSRSARDIMMDEEEEARNPVSPPRQNAARKGPSPRFTIGSDDEDEGSDRGSRGELTELDDSDILHLNVSMQVPTTSITKREFLDAAANNDYETVERWLVDAHADVNVVMGEGWTALLYAVSRGHLQVVKRLVKELNINLNATTITGSSALGMAIRRRSNTFVTLLLQNGASRSTIPADDLNDALCSTWMWEDVKRMLLPSWSVLWTPELHRHFPPDQREKCRLVVYLNALALRQQHRQYDQQHHNTGWIASLLIAMVQTNQTKVKWTFVSEPILYHIFEYAMYLW